MKKITFSTKKISLFLFHLVLVIATSSFACSQNSPGENLKVEAQTLLAPSPKTPENLQFAKSNQTDIAVIKKFAESYEPKSTKQAVIPAPPEPNEDVL